MIKKTNQILLLIFTISLVMIISGCTATPPAVSEVPTQASADSEPAALPEATLSSTSETSQMVAEVEKQAGFDVQEPAYLPGGVSLQSVVFQDSPNPAVILQYKLVHEQFGEMGAFFQIMQEMASQAPADTVSCGENTEGCELLQINDMAVVYRLNPAGPEGMDWVNDGFVFRLLRTAGEPNKVYKDELIKVVESMP